MRHALGLAFTLIVITVLFCTLPPRPQAAPPPSYPYRIVTANWATMPRYAFEAQVNEMNALVQLNWKVVSIGLVDRAFVVTFKQPEGKP